MNLLCPNCQKMLTVPEQFAGQLMKCPLCAGTFTVPGLPAGAAGQPSTPAPPTPAPSMPQETFGMQEPAPPPPMTAPPPPHDMPADATFGSTLGAGTPEPHKMAPAPSLPPAGYTKTKTYFLDGKIMRYVPGACVFLIFILQFFNWVGIYPGGVAAVYQGAWGATVGSYSTDDDLVGKEGDKKQKLIMMETDDSLSKKNKDAKEEDKELDNRPGWTIFLFFYLIPFFYVTLLVTLGVTALDVLKMPPPAAVVRLMPWRWGIVAALNLVTFLFLLIPLVFGFNIESTQSAIYKKEKAKQEKREKQKKEEWDKMSKDEKEQAEERGRGYKPTPQVIKDVSEGRFYSELNRTFWLKLVVFLHLLAIAGALELYWLDRRNDPEHLPKLECTY
jgi:hypothetical protein